MIDIILLLLFFGAPIAMLYFGYCKVHKKKAKISNEPKPDKSDKVVLHGHDLSKWNYLGYTRCTYVDDKGNTTSEYPIFLFVDKNDMKRRSYYVTSEHVEKYHSFMNKRVKPWAAGEGEIYHLINGDGNQPGGFLKEYMLENFEAEWDTNDGWWYSSEDTKYKSATNKQKREREAKPKTETKPESNVVTVEFGKQA